MQISSDLLKQLEVVSNHSGISMDALLREAVSDFMEFSAPTYLARPRPKKKKTAAISQIDKSGSHGSSLVIVPSLY